MKIRAKELIVYAFAVATLAYSGWVLDIPRVLAQIEGEGATCCTYQVDCTDNKVCCTIFPYCSASPNIHICKASC